MRCRGQPRRPCIESWRNSHCIRKRSSITWSGAILNLRRECAEVLIVYQDVALQNAKRAAGETASTIITISVDEKPGVQAIGNTAPDLPPVPGKHPKIGRDHEYERFGTCSILAALDLQDGHVTARVEDRHRSVEFIGLL